MNLTSPTVDVANINHISVVLDESYSMKPHAAAVVKVMDNVIAHLAERSRHYDQETRATVYTFSERGGERCLYYDKDVLRMPSIAGRYKPRSQTALIDATLLAIHDLRQSAQLYGNHAFLIYVLSDGIENDSIAQPAQLAGEINGLPENWTLAAFAPNQQAVFELKRAGFPAENITVWDTTSSVGLEKAGEVIRQSSEAFMEGREHGVHGYNKPSAGGGLFRLKEVNLSNVKAAAVPLIVGSYELLDIHVDEDIRDFVSKHTKRGYEIGKAHYQLTAKSKPVTVQEYKGIFVETDGKIYGGAAIRSLLSLPETGEVKIKGNQQVGCTIFIESRSYNRKLLAGTRLLLLR